MPAPGTPHAPTPDPVHILAASARWTLALVLVIQTFLGFLAPTVLDALFSLWVSRRWGACSPVCDLWYTSLVPWLVYAAAHLLQARALRRSGSFPYSDAQVALMALLPGYNLYGSVALFAAHGDELERRGGGRGLGLELRAAASLASGVAVAVALAGLHLVRPVFAGSMGGEPMPPSRSVVLLVLCLLLLRLYVLARIELAERRARAFPIDAPPQPPRRVAALPGARAAVAATALAVVAGSIAFPPLLWWKAVPDPASSVPEAAPALAVPDPEPADASAEASPPAPAEPTLPPDHLLGGRTVADWRARLTALRERTDDESRQLYELTKSRAVRNGLEVTEVDGRVVVVPTAELIRRALEDAP